MRIDSHQHFWMYHPEEYPWIGENMPVIKRDFLPHHLLPLLQEKAFQGSIAVQARQSIAETEWLLQLAENYSHILGVVGWLELSNPRIEESLALFASRQKLVGLRHVIHDEPNPDFMLQPNFIRGVQLLRKYRLTYDLLLFPLHLPNTCRFLRHFPDDQLFVVDHLAKPPIRKGEIETWKKHLIQVAAFPNVYCKLSGMVTEADWQHWTPIQLYPYLEVALEIFGPQRLMIGSDWPVCLLAGSYGQVMGLVTDYISQLSVAEQELILGKNAARFYNITA